MTNGQDEKAAVSAGQPQDAAPEPRIIQGTRADETLHGRAGDDTIRGGGGSDDIFGHDGDDLLIDVASGAEFVAVKSSRLYGGDGDDRLGALFDVTGGFQFAGNETLVGGDGQDTLRVSGEVLARDVNLTMALLGGDADDRLSSSLDLGGRFTTAVQRASGGDGDDRIAVDLSAGADFAAAYTTVSGGEGEDVLRMEISSRALFGALAETRMRGGAGDDVLDLRITFTAQQDPITATIDTVLFGGSGDDWLRLRVEKPATRFETVSQRLDGGTGNDTVIGSSLADEFVLRAGGGRDRIVGFEEGTDTFLLTGDLTFAALDFEVRPGGTLISDDRGRDLAFVVGVDGLEQNDFLLA